MASSTLLGSAQPDNNPTLMLVRKLTPAGRHGWPGEADNALASRGAHRHAFAMFVITEADAAAIRAIFDQEGELSSSVVAGLVTLRPLQSCWHMPRFRFCPKPRP